MKLFKRQHGFTLIELLIVISILALIVAIVMPNVVKFIGKGKVEGANTEYHQVNVAIIAYTADKGAMNLDGGTIPGATSEASEIQSYLTNYANLQAVYTYDSNGEVISAVPITNSKWNGLDFDKIKGWYKP